MQNMRHVAEKFDSLFNAHVQHITDRFSPVSDLECFLCNVLCVWFLTGQHKHPKEIQCSITLIPPTPGHVSHLPPFDVKGKTSRLITTNSRFPATEQINLNVVNTPVYTLRDLISAFCPLWLINFNHFVDMIQTLYSGNRKRLRCASKMLVENRIKRLINQRRFSATWNSTNDNEFSQWNFHIYFF